MMRSETVGMRRYDAGGYVPGNVAAICRDCNTIKQTQRAWWKIEKVAAYVAKIRTDAK